MDMTELELLEAALSLKNRSDTNDECYLKTLIFAYGRHSENVMNIMTTVKFEDLGEMEMKDSLSSENTTFYIFGYRRSKRLSGFFRKKADCWRIITMPTIFTTSAKYEDTYDKLIKFISFRNNQ